MSRTTTSRKTVRPMTPEAIDAAARADSDAQPLTRSDLKRMPQAKIIRRALGLTQEEFSAHYHIPLGTLRDWEQGRAEPDQPTQAYLKSHCTRTRARRAPIESKAALAALGRQLAPARLHSSGGCWRMLSVPTNNAGALSFSPGAPGLVFETWVPKLPVSFPAYRQPRLFRQTPAASRERESIPDSDRPPPLEHRQILRDVPSPACPFQLSVDRDAAGHESAAARAPNARWS